jgi:UDP-N-acetylmuramoyl-tripeptide--D-alanyl-D-alanine ligase
MSAEAFGKGARHFAAVEEMIAAAREEVIANTTALVKGSRFMRMERVVQALAAEAQKGAH